MNQILINSEDDLENILESAIKDIDSLKDAKIELSSSLTQISILLKGERFKSSLPTSAMEGLISIQDLIYDLAGSMKPNGKRLTQEERKKLELNVKISEGSTDIFIDISEVLKNMTGEQILVGAAILAGTWALVKLGTVITSSITKVKLAKIEATKESVQEDSKKELYSTFENMFSKVVDFKSNFEKKIVQANPAEITLNKTILTPNQIAEANPPKERVIHEEKHVIFSGDFRIQNIRIDESVGTFIDVVHIESKKQIPNVNILVDFISADNYQWLKDAVSDGKGKPVGMNIVAVQKNDKLSNAFIQSFN